MGLGRGLAIRNDLAFSCQGAAGSAPFRSRKRLWTTKASTTSSVKSASINVPHAKHLTVMTCQARGTEAPRLSRV